MNKVIAMMRELYVYDPETGSLTYSDAARPPVRPGLRVGSLDRNGYRKLILKGRTYFAHRAIWMIHHGREPSGFLDHINGDFTDNRIENLRECHAWQNTGNALRPSDASGIRGTRHLVSGKYAARIYCRRKKYELGEFSTRDDARTAYELASIFLLREFSPFHPESKRLQAQKGQA